MKRPITRYKRHRFLAQVIEYAIWLYHRFTLRHRDIDDLLAGRRHYLWRAVDQDGDGGVLST